MSDPSKQEVLDRLLEKLISDETSHQVDAIETLGTLQFSSPAIVRQLEKLALGENEDIRAAALEALKLRTSKIIAAKISTENKSSRLQLVKEINTWESEGLIEPDLAEVLRRRYDFDAPLTDSKTSAASPAAPPPAASTPPIVQPLQPAAQAAPGAPPAPRPSLTQVLLSETSIKIYLYLGAFFVIAAAAILAALVEAARLPVLLIATIAFAAGAVLFKQRLPQPGFAFAIVFSFLLPIDANVISEQLALSPVTNEIYWRLVFLLMAVIWAAGTLFYASRLFSAAAFFSLLLSALRFGGIFEAATDWHILSLAAANMVALLAVRLLREWKDQRFVMPLFLLSQLTQFVLLAASFVSIILNQILSGATAGNLIASTLIWILAACFFLAGDILIPFPLFPWLAAASLFPLPWLVLKAFAVSTPILLAGFVIWGTLAVFASEITHRAASTKYSVPLLTLSFPLYLTAVVVSFDTSDWVLIFTSFFSAGLIYTIANVLRPRWHVWLTALVFGLSAYFAFFKLPFMEETGIRSAYQLLGASLILLIPELFFKDKFTFSRAWNWPPVLMGSLLAALNVLLALGEFDPNESAIVFCFTSLVSAAYAWRFTQPVIGYLATVSGALTAVYALQFYELGWWLPALTALSVLYYAAGFLLGRRENTSPWGRMLRISGLGLSGLISMIALANLESPGGWYALIISALFVIEMYTGKNTWLEILAASTLSIALILLMNDFEITMVSYYLFGLGLLWFTCDIAFKLTNPNRNFQLLTKIIGAAITFAGAVFIATEIGSSSATVCFGIYTLFFACYAWLHKNPRFGFACTSAFALTVYFAASAMNVEKWIFPQIALAAIFYAAAFMLRRQEKAKGWDSTLLLSGLGLGTFVALLAPAQIGGLEKAIPVAIAATFYAAEAFARQNVWLGFPTNGLYLLSYIVLLSELSVDEPQFYTVGAAALGLVQHYLLRRAGQQRAAFIMGILSQLVLLGTSYIQMVDTGELKYFFLLLFQFLAVLAYGIVVRSRSLIIAPIAIVVLAVLTVLYNALKDLSLVIIIGVIGLILLALGVLAVRMRERITSLAERFSDWDA